MDATFRILTKVLPGNRIEFSAPELPEGQEVAVSVVVPGSQEQAGVESLFRTLATSWQNETAAHSSVSQIAMHPAYQGIIGLGRAAIPLILRELQQRPNHWFWALRAITGEDPIQPGQRGKMREMTSAWLQWGDGSKSHYDFNGDNEVQQEWGMLVERDNNSRGKIAFDKIDTVQFLKAARKDKADHAMFDHWLYSPYTGEELPKVKADAPNP